MYPLGYFIVAVANILDLALALYFWVLLAQVVLSWVNPSPRHPLAVRVVRIIYMLTEPVLYKIRTRFPVSFGGIDFSPMIVLLAIYFLRFFLVQSLVRFGSSLL
ncbi:YggT family protein [Desulfatitalea tepidiphila]|jgi:YggT family protein|uniref:YggT family protein n=1 Tax=Desulfatitalea tepidiphila TaxID=1185843 RepID=UPI0006B4F3FA|nr:YggT family protein [Desulfatitalea tepidiphila]